MLGGIDDAAVVVTRFEGDVGLVGAHLAAHDIDETLHHAHHHDRHRHRQHDRAERQPRRAPLAQVAQTEVKGEHRAK